jgi:hypothetical protein
MYCGGGHLGFPIDIKNIHLVENLPMIIPGQFGFNCPSGFREEAFFFYETTWTIETKLPRNGHWKVLYKVYVFYVDRKSKMAATAILIFVVSEKKAFEHFPIGSNVNLCIAVAAILDFRST